MSKANDKKPARAAGAKDAKPVSAVSAAMNPAKTRPMDAGAKTANAGGKGSSANKGR